MRSLAVFYFKKKQTLLPRNSSIYFGEKPTHTHFYIFYFLWCWDLNPSFGEGRQVFSLPSFSLYHQQFVKLKNYKNQIHPPHRQTNVQNLARKTKGIWKWNHNKSLKPMSARAGPRSTISVFIVQYPQTKLCSLSFSVNVTWSLLNQVAPQKMVSFVDF